MVVINRRYFNYKAGIHLFWITCVMLPAVELLTAPLNAADLVPAWSNVEQVATGFIFTEGPAEGPDGGVWFSDVRGNTIWRLDVERGITEAIFENTQGANGLMFDAQDRLVSAAGNGQHVARRANGEFTILADQWNGQSLNSPNDIVIDSQGGIYFSDPNFFGNVQPQAVYYIDPVGELSQVASGISRPNGVILSPDEQTLYIASSGEGRVWAYDVAGDGSLSGKRSFASVGSPDGMTVDVHGNIYVAGNSVEVFNSEGDRLTSINIPEGPTNVTLAGPDNNTLYITAQSSLYRARLNVNPLLLTGDGHSYSEDFDEMGLGPLTPTGWSGDAANSRTATLDSLGLSKNLTTELVNVGGNAERFMADDPANLATWKDDLASRRVFDDEDVRVDAAADRALGVARQGESDLGRLYLDMEIADERLRAFALQWDLEVWGGDPNDALRGSEGGGFRVSVDIGGQTLFESTEVLYPGDSFDSRTTLIDGNIHASREIHSGIIEVSSRRGAVGNPIEIVFDADYGSNDAGWISAVDNVLFRALAAGDAQGDGDVDPSDLIQLLAGGAFGQGNIDASWEQGDFDNDGDFDGTDILAVVQGLAGEFPKTYAHDPNNGVPDVLINPATGNITLDTNGTTIGSIVMDSAAGIFNGPNSPMWDAPGDFAADIDTQISMPISFTNPGYNGVDDLGDGIIGNLAPGFDILSDLTIKYLDPNGDLSDAEAHVVPEPSSIVLTIFGVIGLCIFLCKRRLNV